MPRWSLTVLLAVTAAGAGWLAASSLPPSTPDLPAFPFGGDPRAFGDGPRAFADDCLQVSVALESEAVDPGAAEVLARVDISADADCPSRAVGLDLALVLDTSGSMAGAGKLDEARRAARGVVDGLGPEDRVALVTFADDARLEAPLGSPLGRVRALVAGMVPTGGTALSRGLDEGFAAVAGAPDRARRVLLLTDGLANQGVTAPDALRRRYAGERAALSTVGLGIEYDEALLRTLAESGRGTYSYAESGSQLAGIFATELDAARRIAVRDLQVSLTTSGGLTVADIDAWEADGLGGSRAGVAVGDLARGASRTLLVRLAQDGRSHGAAALSVTVSGAGADGRSMEAGASDSAARDARRAAVAPRDTSVTAASLAARTSAALEAARQAWKRGDDAEARSVLGATRSELEQAGIPEAAAALGTLDDVVSAPSADVAIKRASKGSHDLVR